MAIAHGASSEASMGSPSSTPRTWSHDPGGGSTPDWVLVFAFTYNTETDDITTVSYDGVSLAAVSGGFATTGAAGERGTCKAYFAASGGWGAGAKTVSVSAQGGVTFYAIAISGTGLNAEVHTPGIVLLSGVIALAEQNVTDGSPGTNSLRYAATHHGVSGAPNPGVNSTALQDHAIVTPITIDMSAVRETTAGQGSRPVGYSVGAADDVAAVHLAVREIPALPASQAIVVGVSSSSTGG